MSDTTFAEVTEKLQAYFAARNWTDNPPRGLATSIVLEATELLEHYQWQDEPVGRKDELAEELADIFIYAFQFAMVNDIDIPEAMYAKLAKAEAKYPPELFQNKSEAERSQSWIDAKLNYKKKGL